MTREIKFRVWDVDTKKMVDGLKAVYDYGLSYDTIMQFTGLQDKNGVDIYEGDIGWDDHNEYHGEVVFEDGAFRYLWDNINELLDECASGIAIVGNIYENPELLRTES